MAATTAISPEAAVPYTTATITYHVAQVDDLKLFYREVGPTDAPTIVLLHGYPSSSRMWETLIALLADRYHLIAPDYPGFGRATCPRPINTATPSIISPRPRPRR